MSYDRTMKELVSRIGAPSVEFIAVGDFERIGVFLEVQDWPQYAEMLTRWASSIDSFETTVRRISEVTNLVYYEIEELHRRGDVVNVARTLTVFEFDDDLRVRHLDVYLQQPPR
jgi:hypothetical protein